MGSLFNSLSDNIQKKINDHDAFLEEWEIEVLEENGIVTLKGAVPSQKVAENIEWFTKKQKGVNVVINELSIDETLSESDEEFDIDKDDYVPPIRNHPG